jgi:hypothetical protein
MASVVANSVREMDSDNLTHRESDHLVNLFETNPISTSESPPKRVHLFLSPELSFFYSIFPIHIQAEKFTAI